MRQGTLASVGIALLIWTCAPGIAEPASWATAGNPASPASDVFFASTQPRPTPFATKAAVAPESSAAATGLEFIPVVPCRVVDTRNATGPFGGPSLSAASTREFDIPQSGCGIPSTAVAYSLNTTVVPAATLDYLTLWPTGQAQPGVSTLNSLDGRIKANAAITPAGTSGGVDVYVSNATNVILDIDGYFVPAGTTSALAFYPLTPCRIADTRNSTGPLGGPSVSAATSRSFPVQQSSCAIPATAQAYSLNVTAIPHTTLTYLTTWPTGEAQPNVSTLNALTGAVTANAAIVPAGDSTSAGAVSIYVSDDADVILDVNGYFAPPATGGLSLYTTTPCRALDTRSTSGAFNGVLAAGVEASTCAPPATAQAYVLNATVVPPAALTYLTLWPDGGAQPNVSTLNALDGAITSNMAIVPTTNGTVDAFSSNTTQLILDLSSYFAPSDLPAAATPTFSPAAGAFNSPPNVTLTDITTGASIYYTTDGTPPSTSSTPYSSPISISSTTTINAIAAAPDYSLSAVATATFTIDAAAATPQFSPAPGAYASAQTVTITDATTGASIYYTTDGSAPTAASGLYTAPIAVSSTTTLKAIAISPSNSASPTATATYTLPGSAAAVSVVESTHDQTQLMAAQPGLNFTASTADAGTNTILVDSTQQYQPIDGFGAAFTDSAAYLLEKVAQPSALPGALSDLFTRNGSGIGLSFMRNPIGATDLALSVYSFDDVAAGMTDPTLAHFSIAHDQSYILPLILQSKKLNPQMKILASPWSPPAWMKNTGTMLGGSLISSDQGVFAAYLTKYIQAYQAAGAPIDYLTVANEPLNNTTSYPSILMEPVDQLTLIRDNLLPDLSNNNISTRLMVYDHNWDTPSYPETVLTDPTILASSQVAGTAWHGYGGTPGAQQAVQNTFPAKGAWMTEHSGGTWISDQFLSDFLEMAQVMRNSARGYIKWSLALNEKLGPDLTQNAGLGGCNTCTPIVTVNSTTGAITKDVEYYTLGHYSKYVLPGAHRIYSNNTPSLASVAFRNPDGSVALVAFNYSGSSQAFQVQWGSQAFSYSLPALAAATFAWTGPQGAIPPVAATAQIQGSSYNSETGLETEYTDDATGQYDLGYLSQGATAVYKNVDFGSSVSTVSVREASDGGGGTAAFYLDSPTGTPIATATLPVTGGWQEWQTVTAKVTGAQGVHTLYVVFTGSSSGIANVNWFQFQ